MSGFRGLVAGSMVCAVWLGVSTAASAQTREGFDCSSRFFFGDNEQLAGYQAAACGRAAINRQILINTINVIPHVVANSLGIGPDLVEPAGFADLTSSAFEERLNQGGGIVISPTADVAAQPAPAALWNVWADGKYTHNDNSADAQDLDGPLWNGMAGIDYKLSDAITIGMMGSFESSDLEGDMADLESAGWGGGPYFGAVLTPNLVLSGSLLGTWLDSSQFGNLVDYDSERLQATLSLTGYWYVQNTIRFSPGLSLSWSKEWIEETSGFLLPDQTVETAMLTPTLQLGNTFSLSDTSTVEPWAGVAFDYVFTNTTSTEGIDTVKDPYADLRVQVGFNFGFGTNAQLSVTGEAGGLMSPDLNTYGAELNFAYQF